jgi:hypothetical protein
MNLRRSSGQGGAALIVGMIMLVLITLMLITALNLGTTNFRAVSNMQYRDEALAAANRAIEQVIGSNFTAAPVAEDIPIDVNNDGVVEYIVHIDTPTCVQAQKAWGTDPSSLALPASMTVSSTWNTVWELDATVQGDENAGGAAVRVKSGVRVLLSDSQKTAVCS